MMGPSARHGEGGLGGNGRDEVLRGHPAGRELTQEAAVRAWRAGLG